MKMQCTQVHLIQGVRFNVCEELLFTFLVNCKLVRKHFEASLLNGNLYKVSTETSSVKSCPDILIRIQKYLR